MDRSLDHAYPALDLAHKPEKRTKYETPSGNNVKPLIIDMITTIIGISRIE